MSTRGQLLHGEATNPIFLIFGFTRLGLEPMIYRTRDEHANRYTNDAVVLDCVMCAESYFQCITLFITCWWLDGWFMVLNATFNNISIISWRSVLLVDETGVHPEKTTDLSQVTDRLCWIV
jgi:hypothetical protein